MAMGDRRKCFSSCHVAQEQVSGGECKGRTDVLLCRYAFSNFLGTHLHPEYCQLQMCMRNEILNFSSGSQMTFHSVSPLCSQPLVYLAAQNRFLAAAPDLFHCSTPQLIFLIFLQLLPLNSPITSSIGMQPISCSIV